MKVAVWYTIRKRKKGKIINRWIVKIRPRFLPKELKGMYNAALLEMAKTPLIAKHFDSAGATFKAAEGKAIEFRGVREAEAGDGVHDGGNRTAVCAPGRRER